MAVCFDSTPSQPFSNYASALEAGQEPKTRLESYDHNEYQTLPSISDAVAKFDAINGDNLVSTAFRELFLNYKMDRIFGLILLHRHFDLEQNERLVEYGGTSVPWRFSKISENIRASSWFLSVSGVIRPYEFYYTVTRNEATELDPSKADQRAFLDAFKDLLSFHNAVNLLGLCRYPGDDFPGRIEVTEGRANINLKPEDVSVDCCRCSLLAPNFDLITDKYLIRKYPKDMASRTAAWFFSPPLWEFKCNCGCRYEGSSHSGEHNGHRETT